MGMPLSRHGIPLGGGAAFRATRTVRVHLLCLVFIVVGLLYKIEGDSLRDLLRFPCPTI